MRIAMAKPEEPIKIKKYANRRLYNTGTSTYVTLEDLAVMVKEGSTSSWRTPRPARTSRSRCSRRSFRAGERRAVSSDRILRQLIRFYGDSMQLPVPRYLEMSIDNHPGSEFRTQMAQAFGGGSFGMLEEQMRRNMAMFQKAFSMFTPFVKREGADAADESEKSSAPPGNDFNELKRQMEEMQRRLDRLGDKDKE